VSRTPGRECIPSCESERISGKGGCWWREGGRYAGPGRAGGGGCEGCKASEAKLGARGVESRDAALRPRGSFDARGAADQPRAAAAPTDDADLVTEPRAGWTLETYRDRFERLHDHLRRGDCYQANLTMPIEARWSGDPRSVFWSLVARQPVHYGALIDLGGPVIVSRSPELFFKVDEAGWIETHPMKGTAPRGKDKGEDAAIIAAMLADEKTQAENRMIVDLLRNDISMISEVGTLSVPKLFAIETYPTVHQMVSHVRARLLDGIGLPEIFRALFPCGSITGAPKMWAMRILAELEAGPRDVYCGAIGYCDPAGPMRFSVAIRTLTLFKDQRAVFNVGGGIVFDSKAEAEYEECLLKARFAVGDQWISR